MITISYRYNYVIEYFSKERPIAKSELNYKNPYQLLVAVILSAQCTDLRVNKLTPDFFLRFPSAEKLKKAEISEIYEFIKSCSYPNNKAKYLSKMSKMLVEDFDGKIPEEVSSLIKLPGVGRKTANVIASVIFNKPTMAVDTHVFRVANRIGLTVNAKNPLQSEKQLVKHLAESIIPIAHHWLILHGRYICKARKPECNKCGLTKVCDYYTNKDKN